MAGLTDDEQSDINLADSLALPLGIMPMDGRLDCARFELVVGSLEVSVLGLVDRGVGYVAVVHLEA